MVGLLVLRSRAGRSPPDRPAQRTSTWTAEIQWRDDASRFCVVASPPGAQAEVTLAESPCLEWPPRSDADVDALVTAVADLEQSVVAAGWQVAGPGTSWFGRRFVWPQTDRAPEQAMAVQRA